MKGPGFEGLTFEESLLVVREKVINRMAWVWNSSLEADYAAAKAAACINEHVQVALTAPV
jgi:salicylate hydroxylase